MGNIQEDIAELIEGSVREDQLRLWLEEAGDDSVLSPPGGQPLLAHWVTYCRSLCLSRLPQVPNITKGGYNRSTGQMDPDVDHGLHSMVDRIWPEIWRHIPLGSFCFVRRIPPEAESSGSHGLKLVIPETAKAANHKGWILNVGPEFGDPNPSIAPYGCPTRNPLDLVGRVVSWSMHSGTPLVEHAIDQKWDGEYLLMPLSDLLTLDLTPFLQGDTEL